LLTTTVAQTGTIGIIAGTTSSIDYLFALAYEREALNGERPFEVNRLFQDALQRGDAATGALLRRVAHTGTPEGANEVPEHLRCLFRTALDVAPEWHVHIGVHPCHRTAALVNFSEDRM
jgi:ribonucleoside-diphosphate reductase alpha chain